ncbi:M20 aminoacylase family protein [Sphingomonas sp. NCPPB 2930]
MPPSALADSVPDAAVAATAAVPDALHPDSPEMAAIVALRRDIHAHPELGFEEVRTSELVARKLTEWGIPVHRGLGRTGVVGTLRGTGGTSGRTLALRADMDALPLQEFNTFAHASRHPGRMHACGHDGHTAILLATAQYLAAHRDFDGTLYLVFQPAEEGGGGARVMVEEGLFERFPAEAVFGLHNWPGMAAGHMAVSSGPVMASSNEFRITVRGKGSHAAMPHLGIDPVPIACQMVQAFQNIVSRNKKPLDAGVISVTMVHAGDATNIVPDSCVLEGTVRTFSLEVLDLLEARMRTVAEHTCAAFDAQCEFVFDRNYPPTVNHAAAADFLRGVVAEVVGPDRLQEQEPTMGAEDFSYMLQARPGAYAFLSNGDGSHRDAGHGMGPCMLHNPSYDFNDALIPIGARCWVQLVQKWFAAPSPIQIADKK